jgi:curved DNA-binding protein CbpA
MSDHYSILGLTKSANTAEIKAAYRRLVKIYHPDKNPNSYEAVEKFRQIQEAYETLIDPVSRSKYDGKVSYNEYFSQTSQQAKQQTTQGRGKKYSFTEEDLKRRQYYKENYKRQYDAGKKVNVAEEKKRYNETRYILFSIPLAIGLLFFIINIYERSDKKQTSKETKSTIVLKDTITTIDKEKVEKIGTAAEPYKYYFGQNIIDRNSNQVVAVTNYSGTDAVVCIVDALSDKVVRHYFIENSFNLYFECLPAGKYYLRNYLGEHFNTEKKIKETEISGAFENEKQFQTFKQNPFEIKLQKNDTISFDVIYFKNNKSKNVSNQKDFFFR